MTTMRGEMRGAEEIPTGMARTGGTHVSQSRRGWWKLPLSMPARYSQGVLCHGDAAGKAEPPVRPKRYVLAYSRTHYFPALSEMLFLPAIQ